MTTVLFTPMLSDFLVVVLFIAAVLSIHPLVCAVDWLINACVSAVVWVVRAVVWLVCACVSTVVWVVRAVARAICFLESKVDRSVMWIMMIVMALAVHRLRVLDVGDCMNFKGRYEKNEMEIVTLQSKVASLEVYIKSLCMDSAECFKCLYPNATDYFTFGC
jgi:hypothetical protein